MSDEKDPSPNTPWYADGLPFTCTQCGDCCTGDPGYVWVTDEVMQFFDGDELLKSEQRTQKGEIRKKRASIPGSRAII